MPPSSGGFCAPERKAASCSARGPRRAAPATCRRFPRATCPQRSARWLKRSTAFWPGCATRPRPSAASRPMLPTSCGRHWRAPSHRRCGSGRRRVSPYRSSGSRDRGDAQAPDEAFGTPHAACAGGRRAAADGPKRGPEGRREGRGYRVRQCAGPHRADLPNTTVMSDIDPDAFGILCRNLVENADFAGGQIKLRYVATSARSDR